MKDPKFYVGIVIGFSMSLVLLSIGFIVGPAYAPPTIGTDDIEDNAIISQKIKDGEVKTQDLANAAVTRDKISPFALKLVTVMRSADFTVGASDIEYGWVKCNKGETATGGGHYTSSPQAGTIAFHSLPIQGTHTWEIGVYNPDSNPHQSTVYAICAHLELGP
jgi:hypothetical protein